MPQELTERQKSILDAVIREYVATASPVASADLVEKYGLPFSPATVRGELLSLDEGGFLAQPHTSAGRVPTDSGYRYFINHLMAGDGVGDREERAFRALRGLDEPLAFIRGASRILAEISRSFAVAGFPEDNVYFKTGIGGVMREPEFSDEHTLQEFSSLVDDIENEIAQAFDPADFDQPQTFVGRENPIRQARRCGMIVATCETPFHKESFLALVGPKRMNYERNVALLKRFHDLMED